MGRWSSAPALIERSRALSSLPRQFFTFSEWDGCLSGLLLLCKLVVPAQKRLRFSKLIKPPERLVESPWLAPIIILFVLFVVLVLLWCVGKLLLLRFRSVVHGAGGSFLWPVSSSSSSFVFCSRHLDSTLQKRGCAGLLITSGTYGAVSLYAITKIFAWVK